MFTVIYNPVAGNRKAIKTLPRVLEELNRRNIEYRTMETVYPHNKAHYASVPCGKDDNVCIVGGDGTVLEVINQLPERNMKLISVPCGTGNDFVKCVHLPKNPIKALIRQLDGTLHPLDHVRVSDEYFLNVFGLGFDVEVLKKLDEFKTKHTGLKAYLMALIKAIKEYKPTTVKLSCDGGEFVEKTVSILSVGNGNFIGGGMKAVPDADAFDGYLDVVEVKPVKKRQLLLLLPSFIFGKHVKIGLGKTYRCKSLTIEGKNLSYEIDGEIRQGDRIDLEVLPGQMRFSY